MSGNHHIVLLDSLPCPLKTPFQSHIVEQHKSYRMVVETLESVQANQNMPLFTRGTFCELLRIACTKNAHRGGHGRFRVVELEREDGRRVFYLLVFVCTTCSESAFFNKLKKKDLATRSSDCHCVSSYFVVYTSLF